jgi:hypothetical protein
VEQSTSLSPQDQQARVRIPPGYKVFLGSHSNVVEYVKSIALFCVEKREVKPENIFFLKNV